MEFRLLHKILIQEAQVTSSIEHTTAWRELRPLYGFSFSIQSNPFFGGVHLALWGVKHI